MPDRWFETDFFGPGPGAAPATTSTSPSYPRCSPGACRSLSSHKRQSSARSAVRLHGATWWNRLQKSERDIL